MTMTSHNPVNTETSAPVKLYTVSITFDSMTAGSPLEAAKKMSKWLLEDSDAENMIYEVEDEDSGEKFTVDLSEDDEDAVLPN